MGTSRTVQSKIMKYKPKGGLDHTARFVLALSEVNHESTKQHLERVALLAEATAKILKKDTRAAFFAGLLHDLCKLILPANLFDGHNITAEEYEIVKTHAQASFKVLQKFHLFVALCAGLHHNMYNTGYGIPVDLFPKNWSPATVKKVLDISTIISICDFVDAFTNRKTTIKDVSDAAQPDLKNMLYNKYLNDNIIVDAVLLCYKKVRITNSQRTHVIT
jgi:hypothetical protein